MHSVTQLAQTTQMHHLARLHNTGPQQLVSTQRFYGTALHSYVKAWQLCSVNRGLQIWPAIQGNAPTQMGNAGRAREIQDPGHQAHEC